jgi:spermidine synthase
LIGLWSVMFAVGIAPAGRGLLALIEPQPSSAWHWSVAFFGTLLPLLPATAAMGATLPAMERLLASLRCQGSSTAALYAGNTVGAVFGVPTAAFWLVPSFGLVRTAAACAIVNLLCAAATIAPPSPHRYSSRCDAGPDPHGGAPPEHAVAVGGDRAARHRLRGEVLVVRVLSQVSENTVYTFARLLAVYVFGTTADAAVYPRWVARAPGADGQRQRLLWMLAAACLFGTASLWCAKTVKASEVPLSV